MAISPHPGLCSLPGMILGTCNPGIAWPQRGLEHASFKSTQDHVSCSEKPGRDGDLLYLPPVSAVLELGCRAVIAGGIWWFREVRADS